MVAGLGVALALAAKLTALAVVPAAALAMGWPQPGGEPMPKKAWPRLSASRLLLGAMALGLALYILYPAFWVRPLAGVQAAVAERQAQVAANAEAWGAAAPGSVQRAPGERVLAGLVQLYLAPPAFAELPNYAAETRAAEARYLASPWLGGLRFGFAFGIGWLVLTVLGLALGGYRVVTGAGVNPAQRRVLAIALVWAVASLGGMATLALAWQRYSLSTLPAACLWAAYGLTKWKRAKG
jgi:hypothetical protein